MKPMKALPSAAIITVMDATEKRLKMTNGMTTANQMRTPPIVGVPSLVLWPAGPSSRMFWPNSLRRSQRMKAGPMMSISTMATTLAPIALSIGGLRDPAEPVAAAHRGRPAQPSRRSPAPRPRARGAAGATP